ncbi:MAG: hypothetical protein L3J82_08010 [Planctomycetes bacterium]|nr:hypothetical protein [Planctomycetota bacterium]
MSQVDFKERGVQVVVAGFVICFAAPITRVTGGGDTAAAIILSTGMLTVLVGIAIMMISRRRA